MQGSKKARNSPSITNNTNIYGIMGGLSTRVGASNPGTYNHLLIKSGRGLPHLYGKSVIYQKNYLFSNKLVSVNPVGSGGVGKTSTLYHLSCNCSSGFDSKYSEPSSSTGADIAYQPVTVEFANQILVDGGIDANTASTAITEYTKAISNGDEAVMAITKVANALNISINVLIASITTNLIQVAGVAEIDTFALLLQYTNAMGSGVDYVTAITNVATALSIDANAILNAANIAPAVISSIVAQYISTIASGVDYVTAITSIVNDENNINSVVAAAAIVSSVSQMVTQITNYNM